MRKRLIALLSALILFLTGCTNAKSEDSSELTEVLNTTNPDKIIEETISMLTKETKPIIIDENTIAIETTPIIEETKPALLTLDEIALEVIGGKWGSGDTRRNSLTAAGYNYDEVIDILCEIGSYIGALGISTKDASNALRDLATSLEDYAETPKQKEPQVIFEPKVEKEENTLDNWYDNFMKEIEQ